MLEYIETVIERMAKYIFAVGFILSMIFLALVLSASLLGSQALGGFSFAFFFMSIVAILALAGYRQMHNIN